MKIREAKAHCDIPCAVYDPAVAQYAALSVVRFLDLIGEMPDDIQSKKDLAHLSRLVQQKEEHAIEVKECIFTLRKKLKLHLMKRDLTFMHLSKLRLTIW